jgi:hypothetical protein
MNSDDISRIKSLTETLQQDYARVMQAQAANEQGGADQQPPSPDGDVVDGEFTEQS